MAFNDLDRKRCERAMEPFLNMRRPPRHVRPELDIGVRVVGQSVEIFIVRPMPTGVMPIGVGPLQRTDTNNYASTIRQDLDA